MGKKILKLILVLVTCFCVLTACSVKRYNATIYNDTKNSLRKEFLAYNMTRGSYYQNDNGEIVKAVDSDLPGDYTYVVKTKEHAEEIFYELPFETNFDEQMLIIYIFTDLYNRPYEIKKISCRHGELRIDVELQSVPFGVLDGVAPYQRVIIIQMDKLDFDTVVINEL